MKETLKSKKGITLIALVITIIVLIILAGISISMLMGTDGIITKAKEGRQNMQNAAIEEQERLNTLYAEFESGVIGTGSYDAIAQLINFKRTIAQAITDAGVATSEDDDAETMAENIAQLGEDSTEAPVLLWENPNPTTYMPEREVTIEVDLSDYSYLIFKVNNNVIGQAYELEEIIVKPIVKNRIENLSTTHVQSQFTRWRLY